MFRLVIVLSFIAASLTETLNPTDDSEPAYVPRTPSEPLPHSDIPSAFVMPLREMEEALIDLSKNYVHKITDDYVNALNTYLMYHGLPNVTACDINDNGLSIEEQITGVFRLLVFFVDPAKTSYIQSSFIIDNEGHLMTAEHGFDDKPTSMYACDYETVQKYIIPDNAVFEDRQFFDDNCDMMQKMVTPAISNIDDIAFCEPVTQLSQQFETPITLDLNLDFDARINSNSRLDKIFVCFGAIGHWNPKAVTMDGVKVDRTQFTRIMGRGLRLLYTFGQINDFDNLFEAGCNLNGIDCPTAMQDYLQLNPATPLQQQHSVYSNITFEGGLSGGYCGPVLHPFTAGMVISLGKHTVINSDHHSFANQHTAISKSPSAKAYESNYHQCGRALEGQSWYETARLWGSNVLKQVKCFLE